MTLKPLGEHGYGVMLGTIKDDCPRGGFHIKVEEYQVVRPCLGLTEGRSATSAGCLNLHGSDTIRRITINANGGLSIDQPYPEKIGGERFTKIAHEVSIQGKLQFGGGTLGVQFLTVMISNGVTRLN